MSENWNTPDLDTLLNDLEEEDMKYWDKNTAFSLVLLGLGVWISIYVHGLAGASFFLAAGSRLSMGSVRASARKELMCEIENKCAVRS